jgi:hypothetical protein
MERIAHPFYNSRAAGGEGHLEVAKNVYYHNHGLCHMVLSLKPFGCMPSTQSDGVQSAVVSSFTDMIYLPIETSGEGEINAHSRVQMALGEARAKARAEFARVVKESGYSLAQIRSYVAEHPHLGLAGHRIEHVEGIVGIAPSFVIDVAARMRADRVVPAPSADLAAEDLVPATEESPVRQLTAAGDRVPERGREETAGVIG